MPCAVCLISLPSAGPIRVRERVAGLAAQSMGCVTHEYDSPSLAGSGIISIEYAKIFNYLETKVTLVIRGKSFEAALERIGVDAEVAATLQVKQLAASLPDGCLLPCW